MMKRVAMGALAGAALLFAIGQAGAAEISGAGATFPYPIYAKWADAYKTKTGIGLNYQSIGSGGGIKQIEFKTVDFGASDMPLEPKDLEKAGLMQFPMVMGAEVAVVNLKGINAGDIKLTGSVIADIYLKKIAKWNDPALAKLNPGVKLPDQAITVVHRSDGSGTTFIFTHYLSQISPEWKSTVGENTSVQWPTGVGAKGNEGVANYVKQIDGGIGYVEYAYALQNKLVWTELANSTGKFLKPTTATFMAAASNAEWEKTQDFYLLLTNQPGDQSWPITGATFILMHKSQDKPEVAAEVLKFFDWAYHDGGKLAEELDYIPMPANVVKLVEQTWEKEIKSKDGKPVFTANMVTN